MTLAGDKLDELGMLVDFREVREIVKGIVGKFDHCLVNEIEPFNRVNPTAENLARFIYEEVKTALPQLHVKSVQIWESSTACACYGEYDE